MKTYVVLTDSDVYRFDDEASAQRCLAVMQPYFLAAEAFTVTTEGIVAS